MTLLPLEPEQEPPFTWDTRLQANEAAGPNARLRTRTQLTIANWRGNVDQASRVADKLMDNAVKHGKSFDDDKFPIRLIVLPEEDELAIEVDDANPEFPDFDQAVSRDLAGGPPRTGLEWALHYRGRLSWDVITDDAGQVTGKTVQAVLPAIWGGDV
ncbi:MULTISPECIES: hypothetical protein [Streptomyces]|uniref:Histidine kinase/HSP90-like ATPase domain-containing protein n=2 Tax=Streptomyces TaxID=1883 RepID=A0ABV9IWM3_9ACTN